MFSEEKRFIHDELGWNYRMTNLQAALGIAQLERLDSIIKIKLRNGSLYNKFLEGINGIKLFNPKEMNYAKNIYWVYGILIDPNIGTAENIMAKLNTLKLVLDHFFIQCISNQF